MQFSMFRSQSSRPVRDAFETASSRAITFFMSTRTEPTSTPYSPARAAMRAAYALATIVLVGMQPVIDARSAEDVALDDRHVHSGAGETRGHVLAGLAGADDDRVVGPHVGSSVPACSATMYAAYHPGQFASLWP